MLLMEMVNILHVNHQLRAVPGVDGVGIRRYRILVVNFRLNPAKFPVLPSVYRLQFQ